MAWTIEELLRLDLSKRKPQPKESYRDYYDEISDFIDEHPIGLPGAGRFGSMPVTSGGKK